MISIILNCFNPTKWQAHMTMACIAAIKKFTDGEYELIVIDNEPAWPILDVYKVFEPYTHIINEKNRTCTESYNQGAALAKGDILVFIQSDVFVNERTINKLAAYIESGKWDVVYPQQIEHSRQDILDLYKLKDGELAAFGYRDAGLLMITKEGFDKTGGWPEEYRNLLQEAAYYAKIDAAGLRWTSSTNAIITHIMAANNLSKDVATYNEEMAWDSKLYNGG